MVIRSIENGKNTMNVGLRNTDSSFALLVRYKSLYPSYFRNIFFFSLFHVATFILSLKKITAFQSLETSQFYHA